MNLKKLIFFTLLIQAYSVFSEDRFGYKEFKLGDKFNEKCPNKKTKNKGFVCSEEGSFANVEARIGRDYIENQLSQILIVIKKPEKNFPLIFEAMKVKYGPPTEIEYPILVFNKKKKTGLTAFWSKKGDGIYLDMFGNNEDQGFVHFISKEYTLIDQINAEKEGKKAAKDL